MSYISTEQLWETLAFAFYFENESERLKSNGGIKKYLILTVVSNVIHLMEETPSVLILYFAKSLARFLKVNTIGDLDLTWIGLSCAAQWLQVTEMQINQLESSQTYVSSPSCECSVDCILFLPNCRTGVWMLTCRT